MKKNMGMRIFAVCVMLVGAAMMLRGLMFVARAKEQEAAFEDALSKIAGDQPGFVTEGWIDYAMRRYRYLRDAAAEPFTWGLLLIVGGVIALAVTNRGSGSAGEKRVPRQRPSRPARREPRTNRPDSAPKASERTAP